MSPKSDSGLTLIEVIVGMSLTVVLSAGVVGLLRLGVASMEYAQATSVRNHSNLITTRTFTGDVGKAVNLKPVATCTSNGASPLLTVQRANILTDGTEQFWFVGYEVRSTSTGSGELWRVTCNSMSPADPLASALSPSSQVLLNTQMPATTDPVWINAISSPDSYKRVINFRIPKQISEPWLPQFTLLAARDAS